MNLRCTYRFSKGCVLEHAYKIFSWPSTANSSYYLLSSYTVTDTLLIINYFYFNPRGSSLR